MTTKHFTPKKLLSILFAFLATIVWICFALQYINYPTSPNRLLFIKALFLFYSLCAFILIFLPLSDKLKKWYKYLLPIAIPPFLGVSLEYITIDPIYTLDAAFLYNVLLFYIIEIIFILIMYSATFGSLIASTFILLLYIINYFVYQFRHVPFSYNDIFAINTVKQVISNYKFIPGSLVLFCLAKYILVVIALLKTRIKKPIAFRSRIIAFASALVLSVVGWFTFVNLNFWGEKGFPTTQGFTNPYHYDGLLVYSCITLATEKHSAPDGYSEEMAISVLSNYDTPAEITAISEDTPHIIIVMNESLFDPYVWGDVELNDDPLNFFNSLSQNTMRGYLNSSVLGGSTCNAEFEILTGHSMAFFSNGFYPYLQAINSSTPSIVSIANDMGYTTHSIHPELSTNWNRHLVYNHLGFQKQHWIYDFVYAEALGNGVSDASTFDKIIELYETRQPDEKLFVFDLTIQNHGGYTWLELDQTISSSIIEHKDFNNYLSLIDITDDAFKELVSYFTAQDEKVIICMFGDHQPLFPTDLTYDLVCKQTEGLSDKDLLLNLYKTPFVIWANYDIPAEDNIDISMNYFSLLLAKAAKLPFTPYMHFLEELAKHYPIISANGYVDANGQFYTIDHTDEWLNNYSILQYYMLTNQQ